MTLSVHGHFDGGFSWQARPGEFMERSSTALAAGGRVWLVDPMRAAGLEAAIARLGKVAAVVQTVAWHDRDVAWFAHLYGVPVHVPRGQERTSERLDGTEVTPADGAIPDTPLRFIPVGGRLWREAVVWWPDRRVLVAGDTLGSAAYFLQPGERLGVHPLRRLWPPERLLPLRPERIHVGHGLSIAGGAAAALEHAVVTSRSTIAGNWATAARVLFRRAAASLQRP